MWRKKKKKQKKKKKKVKDKNRESVNVNFTHMGSRSRKTDCYETWQYSSINWRYHSLKIWYWLVQ